MSSMSIRANGRFLLSELIIILSAFWKCGSTPCSPIHFEIRKLHPAFASSANCGTEIRYRAVSDRRPQLDFMNRLARYPTAKVERDFVERQSRTQSFGPQLATRYEQA